ncbi:hypothetical protein F5146DRAFT_1116304 [Armillaria mellea]|nr:hypothetical protein F5146DRAFT_1116304 [Armillaria mellea]
MRFETQRGSPTAFKSTSRRKSLCMLGKDTRSARLCTDLLQSSSGGYGNSGNLESKAVRTRLGKRIRRRALPLCLYGRARRRGGWKECHSSPSVVGHDCCWFLSWEVVQKLIQVVPALGLRKIFVFNHHHHHHLQHAQGPHSTTRPRSCPSLPSSPDFFTSQEPELGASRYGRSWGCGPYSRTSGSSGLDRSDGPSVGRRRAAHSVV